MASLHLMGSDITEVVNFLAFSGSKARLPSSTVRIFRSTYFHETVFQFESPLQISLMIVSFRATSVKQSECEPESRSCSDPVRERDSFNQSDKYKTV